MNVLTIVIFAKKDRRRKNRLLVTALLMDAKENFVRITERFVEVKKNLNAHSLFSCDIFWLQITLQTDNGGSLTCSSVATLMKQLS